MSAKRSGQAWTGAEERKLADLASRNTPTRLIAYKLQRSEDAVRTKASDLDVSLKPTNQSPYGTSKK